MSNLRSLRPYQKQAVEEIFDSLADNQFRVMLQGPCGFGKTLTAAHIIETLIQDGLRVCFVVPRLTLLDQTVKGLEEEGLGHQIGVIQSSHEKTDPDALIQVASLQTLTRRTILPHIDMFIVDEAHMTSEKFLKLMQSMPEVPFIGLSATPWRKGLGNHYKKLIVAETSRGLIDQGYLVPFNVYAPAPPLDLSRVKTTAGDYNQQDLSKAVNKKELVGDIVLHYQKLGEDRPTICFCVDRSHAQHVQELFIEAGIKAGYVDCFTSDDDRRQLIEDFKSGDVRVICNVGVLTTGFDAPQASCMIDAAPTKSLILHVQKTGRVLRTSKGKSDAIILDHAGNALRLGLITDITCEEMCDGTDASREKRKKQDNEPKPRLCEECKTVMPPLQNVCPQCGNEKHKWTVVVNNDGILSKIGQRTQAFEYSEEAQEDFYLELKTIGRERGYKEGWAAVQFKEKYGDWPPKHLRYVDAKEPTISTRNWIKSKQIAWAKAQSKKLGREQSRSSGFMRGFSMF